tara:strand:+ start:281 stop:958 length:678 start_codon:yes stop_codon:yes gene_type:complete
MNKKLNIELKNIFLNIDGNEIFRNFSIKLASTGISVILGTNGSGKTLLTKIIKGMINIDKGKVLFKKNIEIGYAPQKVVFLRRNVFENIAFPLRVIGKKEFEINERVNFLLKKFNIFEKKFLSARTMSAGNAQFISFVRSIVNDPQVLILDEACSNLDDSHRKKLELYLQNNRKTKKIIMITHDFLQAKRLADELIIIGKGKLLEKLNKQKFIKNEKNVIKNFFS